MQDRISLLQQDYRTSRERTIIWCRSRWSSCRSRLSRLLRPVQREPGRAAESCCRRSPCRMIGTTAISEPTISYGKWSSCSCCPSLAAMAGRRTGRTRTDRSGGDERSLCDDAAPGERPSMRRRRRCRPSASTTHSCMWNYYLSIVKPDAVIAFAVFNWSSPMPRRGSRRAAGIAGPHGAF